MSADGSNAVPDRFQAPGEVERFHGSPSYTEEGNREPSGAGTDFTTTPRLLLVACPRCAGHALTTRGSAGRRHEGRGRSNR